MEAQPQAPVLVGVRDGRKVVCWRAVFTLTLLIAAMTGVGILTAWALFRIFLGRAFPLYPIGLLGAFGPAILGVSLRLLREWRQPMDRLPRLD